MQNSTQLFRIEKVFADNTMKKIYSEHLYTLESNNGRYASVYLDNVQQDRYYGEGAWAQAQRQASALAIKLDMGDL